MTIETELPAVKVKDRSDRVEQLAEYLCSEFDFSLDPCVGYSWPEHPKDDGYRGDGNWVKLQPSDVQAYARENAARILAFLSALTLKDDPGNGGDGEPEPARPIVDPTYWMANDGTRDLIGHMGKINPTWGGQTWRDRFSIPLYTESPVSTAAAESRCAELVKALEEAREYLKFEREILDAAEEADYLADVLTGIDAVLSQHREESEADGK